MLTGKERADEVYSSERTSTTNHVNSFCATMTHPRPLPLFGRNGKLVGLDKGFGACTSRREWVGGGGMESYKLELTNNLKDFIAGIDGTIWKSTKGHSLARDMLNAVKSQWNDFLGFIDDFYGELTVVAGFSQTKAWELVGRAIGAFFQSMRVVRRRAMGIQDANSLENKALLLWTVLQGHRAAKTFIDLDFRGHPAIVKEMSLFMLTERVDPSQLTALEEKVSKVNTAVVKQNVSLEKLDQSQSTLKRTLDNLQNNVTQLKNKIK